VVEGQGLVALNINAHIRAIVLDGVFASGGDGPRPPRGAFAAKNSVFLAATVEL
jgi:hypothetical protein